MPAERARVGLEPLDTAGGIAASEPREIDELHEEPPQLTRAVLSLLQSHLRSQVFPEGLVLGEAAIARALDISRTPVRAALEQLLAEGLLVPYAGRGLLVSYGGQNITPQRLSLSDAGLQLSATARQNLGFSGAADRIYPSVEAALASCAAFGRFHVSQTGMATHFGTSRTVAHDILNRLQRVGLVVQDRNARWYVPRLSAPKAAEHYRIREVLEPEALLLAFPTLDETFLRERWERLVGVMQGDSVLAHGLFDQIERDLHYDIIHRCPNRQMVKVIKESQLPLIATRYTVERYQDVEVLEGTLPQHLSVFTSLLEGNADRAAEALRYHLARASEVNIPRLGTLPPLSSERYPPYISLVAD